MVEISKAHFAAPTLSWCLRHDATVGVELRSYLDAVLRLNGKRNERLCDTLEQVTGALNEIDIEPVLLKGIAYLVSGYYPALGARLVGDLDLLIPRERAQDAAAAMARIGFVVDQVLPENHHHLPRMRHVETSILVELHMRVLPRANDPIIPVEWFRTHCQPVAFRGLRLQMPDATALVGHNVAHDQLAHGRYSWKQVEIRQLVDLALTRAKHENAINWMELNKQFDKMGQGRVLATYLRYGEKLFGQPMPALSSAPRARAVARLRRAVEEPPEQRHQRRYERQVRINVRRYERQVRINVRLHRREARIRKFSMLLWLPRDYVVARLRDPRGIVRLFDPRAWVRQFRAIWRGLKA